MTRMKFFYSPPNRDDFHSLLTPDRLEAGAPTYRCISQANWLFSSHRFHHCQSDVMTQFPRTAPPRGSLPGSMVGKLAEGMSRADKPVAFITPTKDTRSRKRGEGGKYINAFGTMEDCHS